MKEGKIYISKNKRLRMKIIQLHHEVLAAGYRERLKMTELVIRNYWWLGVIGNVGQYVERCDMCQWMKNRTEALVGKLKLSEVPEKL